jgi:hypothetical protein
VRAERACWRVENCNTQTEIPMLEFGKTMTKNIAYAPAEDVEKFIRERWDFLNDENDFWSLIEKTQDDDQAIHLVFKRQSFSGGVEWYVWSSALLVKRGNKTPFDLLLSPEGIIEICDSFIRYEKEKIMFQTALDELAEKINEK